MSTGARTDQIEAAVERRWPANLRCARRDMDYHVDLARSRFVYAAQYLVPPGSAIIDAEDVAAIRLVVELSESVAQWWQSPFDDGGANRLLAMYAERITPDVLDRLRRIGGEG